MKENQDWRDDWNTLHCKYIKEEMENCHSDETDGYHRSWPRAEMINHRNKKMADYCEGMIAKAKTAYYDTGDAIMSDEIYDGLENRLKALRPESQTLHKVGS